MLGKFLAAASKLGLKVLVGLMLVPMPDADVASIGKLYVELVTDLYSGYGHNAAFGGYYLTQEWGWREGDFEQVKLNIGRARLPGFVRGRWWSAPLRQSWAWLDSCKNHHLMGL